MILLTKPIKYTVVIIFVVVLVTISYVIISLSVRLGEAKVTTEKLNVALSKVESNFVNSTAENKELVEKNVALEAQIESLSYEVKSKESLVEEANAKLDKTKLESYEVIYDTRLDIHIAEMVLTYYEALRENDLDKFLSVTSYKDHLDDAYDWMDREKMSSSNPAKIKIEHMAEHGGYISIHVDFHGDGVTDTLAAVRSEGTWYLVDAS